jgi:uncharacterized membrane protein
MTTFLTIAVQWLHVAAGALWMGGQVFSALVLWPAMLRRPPAEALDLMRTMGPLAGRVMGRAGMLVLLLGPIRGTVLGPIRSWSALATPYGITFGAALLITLALMVYGGATRGSLVQRVWQGDGFHPGARAYLRQSAAINLGGLALIFTCMVLMHFGL